MARTGPFGKFKSYLTWKGLWLYISGSIPKPTLTDADKFAKWEEVDAQALSMILMNIVPNMQAGLDCSSTQATWDGLSSQYAQPDPITQNLAQTCRCTKCFMEGSMETLPAHIAELQWLREVCRGLGVDVMDAQFAWVITLSNTFMGSCHRHPMRSPRYESSHLASQHQMKQETRAHLQQ